MVEASNWRPHKIAVLGVGEIGTNLRDQLTISNTADIVKSWNWQPKEETGPVRAGRLSLDQGSIARAHIGRGYKPTTQFDYFDTHLEDTVRGADYIIITSGEARKPGQERKDLLARNCPIMDQTAEAIAKNLYDNPNVTILVDTNPVDAMTLRLVQKLKDRGVAPNRIIGLSGELDSTRMVQSICMNLQISPEQIQDAYVIGAHGPTMVPIFSNVTIKKADGSSQSLAEYAEEYARNNPERVEALKKEYIDSYILNNAQEIKAYGKSNAARFPQEDEKERNIAIAWDILNGKEFNDGQFILDKIKEETRHGGTILTRLKEKKSDGYAPAIVSQVVLERMIEARRGEETWPIYGSVYSDTDQLCMGRGVLFQPDGTYKLAEPLKLNEAEQAALNKSRKECEDMRSEMAVLDGVHHQI